MPPSSSGCRWPASSASRSPWPEPGPASQRFSLRPPARSTSTRPRASVSTGSLAAVVVWFEPRRAFVAGVVLGLVQATVASAHWSGAAAYRDVLPLAIGLALLAWRARSTPEAIE